MAEKEAEKIVDQEQGEGEDEDVQRADQSACNSDESNKEEELKKALEEKEKEAAHYKELWLRALADYDNLKKRTQKEIENIQLYAGEQLIKDIIPVLDNFERAIDSVEDVEDKESAFYNGIKMIYNQLKGVMKKYGVEEIEAQGKPFDPKLHEAIMTVESEEYEDETVVEVLRKGYTYHSKVIRPSLVKVAKK